MSNYINCDICEHINIKDSKYCNKCGHRFGVEDWDREFRAGEFNAQSKMRSYFFNWLGILSVFIAILGFLGFSGMSSVKEDYEKELQKIKTSKIDLEKNYKELSKLSENLTSLTGMDNVNISDMIQTLYVNFYSIREIYVYAKYEFSDDVDKNSQFNTYNQIDITRKNGFGHAMEFVKMDNGTKIGDRTIAIKYKLFQPFERRLISKKLSKLNDLGNIKFRASYNIFNKINYDKVFNEIKVKQSQNNLTSISLSIFVNAIKFWDINIKDVNRFEKMSYTERYDSPSLLRITKYFNFEFKPVNNIIQDKFNTVIENQREGKK